MERNTVRIAARYKRNWIFVKQKDKKTFRMPGGRAYPGVNIYEEVKEYLYMQTGVVSAYIYRINEFLFIADVKCIAAKPAETDIEAILEVREESVYDVSSASPMRGMTVIERNLFIKLHDWLLNHKNISKENCIFYEKVCGAVTYKFKGGIVYYLLIRNESGHIGFPKGHVENGETEYETAKRELLEETGLNIPLMDGFRHSFEYIVSGNKRIKKVIKHAVYFIAEFHDQNVQIQQSEISKWWLVPYEEALSLLNKEEDKELLQLANNWINKNLQY